MDLTKNEKCRDEKLITMKVKSFRVTYGVKIEDIRGVLNGCKDWNKRYVIQNKLN